MDVNKSYLDVTHHFRLTLLKVQLFISCWVGVEV